ncbi:hypothetical protein [Streptomyces spiralis]
MTSQDAIDRACTLLDQAELELTNLPLMERLDELACTWLTVAAMLAERERV